MIIKKILRYSVLFNLLVICAGWILWQSDPSGAYLIVRKNNSAEKKKIWMVGFGRRVITPQNAVWLAGYGTKRVAENKIHDIWVKVMALKSPDGKSIVIATTDHMGMSKTVYESIYSKVNQYFGISRPDFMLTFS